jgi:1-acyl-sn-glycerol-3-phosphate acyltransferase
MFWWLMKYVLLGPVLRVAFRPKVRGLEHVPREGPAILAANHVSPLDTVLLPLVVPRKVVFLAKAEYFQRWTTAWFFRGAGCIPIRRESRTNADAALRGAVEALGRGELVGIFPEGTRSPDGRMYRGKTGVARLALWTGAPVVPVGIRGTFEAMPYHRRLPRPRRVEVAFGPPLAFEDWRGRPVDRDLLRAVTERIMEAIRELSGQERVDQDAAVVKLRLREAGRGGDPGRVGEP